MSVINNSHRFGKVAVLYGGVGSEREVSLSSGTAVLKGLLAAGIDAHAVDVGLDIISVLQAGRFDRAFNILHGRLGEDGVIQGALELLDIPYTGCGVMASALSLDKLATKRVWQGAGLPTPRYETLTADSDFSQVVATLGLPLIVKPSCDGSSVGLSKVSLPEELPAAYEKAAAGGGTVLVEQWIHGAEYTASIIAGESLPLIRIEATGELYDYEAKYHSDDTRYFCPCGLEPDEEARLQTLALQAFHYVNGTGWGRVDMMRDSQTGEVWLIELNTSPGMTDHSLVPMAAKAKGLNFSELVVRILETTL